MQEEGTERLLNVNSIEFSGKTFPSKKFLRWSIGLSHLHAPSYKIRLFAFSSEISQRIFVKIHCENTEFGSLRDPGLLQVENLQQPH